MLEASRSVTFGPFVADLAQELLWREGELVHVPRKTFQVLAVLLRHHGEVVPKDSIFTAVWGEAFVEENTLARHIAILRRTLGDIHNSSYIVTVHGWGYRFVAPVSCAAKCQPAGDPQTDQAVSANVADRYMPVVPRPLEDGRDKSIGGRVSMLFSGILAIGVLAWLGSQIPGTAMSSQQADPARALKQITYEGALQQQPSWSPDGASIAYASDHAGNLDIWIQRVNETSRQRLTTSAAHDSQPAWSPDGRTIAFRSDQDGGGLYLIGADGVGERRLTSFGYFPRWSFDSRSLLLANRSLEVGPSPNLFVVDVDGGAARPVLADWVASMRAVSASWVPGERVLSAWGYRPTGEPAFITAAVGAMPTTWTLPQSLRDQLAASRTRISEFAWAPSRRYLYLVGDSDDVRNIWRVAVDVSTHLIGARMERLTTSPNLEQHLAVSPDGRQIAFSERFETRRLRQFPFDSRAGRVTGPGLAVTSASAVGDEKDPAVSADGEQVVYRTTRDGRQDLWQVSLVTGSEHLLLSDQLWQRTNPHWSRDGSRLAYARSRSISVQGAIDRSVVVIPAGGGPERVIATSALTPSDWAPDGTALIGGCSQPRRLSAICLLPITSSAHPVARVIADDPSRNLYAPRYSPEQDWITFTAVDPANTAVSAIYALRLADGMRVQISDRAAWDDKVRWGADGRAVYWVSDRTGHLNIWARRFDRTTGRPLEPAFQVTALDDPRQGIPNSIRGLEFAITADKLIVPISDAKAGVWVLDGVDR
jgi:Tol biopolymer transport system component/DNA-binding winged helix-turn-helix (wHTH) protein